MKNMPKNTLLLTLHMLFNARVLMDRDKTEEKFGPFTDEQKEKASKQYQTDVFYNAKLAGYLS